MTKLVNAKKRLRKRLRKRAKRRAKRPSRVRVAKKKARKKEATTTKKTKKIIAASKFTIKQSTSDRRRDSISIAAWRSSSRFWMRNSSNS